MMEKYSVCNTNHRLSRSEGCLKKDENDDARNKWHCKKKKYKGKHGYTYKQGIGH